MSYGEVFWPCLAAVMMGLLIRETVALILDAMLGDDE